MNCLARDDFVRLVLDLYRNTPGTRGRARPADRRLAEDLHHQGITIDQIRAAFLLATARRTFRPPDSQPLHTIASLHYFLPVLHELQGQPLEPGYLAHLRTRLASLTPRPGQHGSHRST